MASETTPFSTADRIVRHTPAHPCLICHGHSTMPSGRDIRCAGFLSSDGLYEHCQREHLAGALPLNLHTEPPTYAHKLYGRCDCGTAHNLVPAPRRRGTTSTTRQAVPSQPAAPGSPKQAQHATTDQPPRAPKSTEWTWPTAATYDYRNADGTLCYQVVRKEEPVIGEMKRGKLFLQRHRPRAEEAPHRDGWVYKMDGIERLLYRLPELLASPPEEPVYIVEGEKCVDLVRGLAFIATCSLGGAGKWRNTPGRHDALRNRHVVLLPDNDGLNLDHPQTSFPGQRHMRDVAEDLAGVAASVRVLLLPDLPERGDVEQWIAAGGTAEAFRELTGQAPVWTPDFPLVPDLPPDLAEQAQAEHATFTGATTGGSSAASRRRHRQETTKQHRLEQAIALPDALPISHTRWFFSAEQWGLYECLFTADDDGELLYKPVNQWGAPHVHAVVVYGSDEAATGQHARYDVEIEGQREEIGRDELHSGEAWDRWGTLGIAGRAAIAGYAAAVEEIARYTGVPKYKGSKHTGWVLHTAADGATHHVLSLPDGSLVGADGILPGAKMYLHLADKHIRPYQAPAPVATPEEQLEALTFLERVSKHSIAPLTFCAHLRSLTYALYASDCSLILRGPSGRGKTSIANFGRNLTGSFPFGVHAATAAFGDTVTSIEDSAAAIKHLPVLVDDLAIKDGMAESKKSEMARILDMVLRSVGNGTAVRERMTRSMERQIARKIDALPVITAEQFPDVLASALNRAMVIDLEEGDLDKTAMKAESEQYAPALRTLGLGFVAWLAGQWDERQELVATTWRDWQQQMAGRIERDLLAARSSHVIPDYATRLPNNGAHILLAAYLLEQYLRQSGLLQEHEVCPLTVDALYPDVLAHLQAQIAAIGALETGGDTQPLEEWACEQLRSALATHTAHLKITDGSLPSWETQYLVPSNLGYDENYEGALLPRGVYLGDLSPDGTQLALDTHNVFSVLKAAAKREKRPWSVSERHLPTKLRDAGVVDPDPDGRHIERKVRIRGLRTRRLIMRREWLWPLDEGNDAGDGNDQGSPPSPPDQPSEPVDDRNGPNSPANPEAYPHRDAARKSEGLDPTCSLEQPVERGGPTGPTPHIRVGPPPEGQEILNSRELDMPNSDTGPTGPTGPTDFASMRARAHDDIRAQPTSPGPLGPDWVLVKSPTPAWFDPTRPDSALSQGLEWACDGDIVQAAKWLAAPHLQQAWQIHARLGSLLPEMFLAALRTAYLLRDQTALHRLAALAGLGLPSPTPPTPGPSGSGSERPAEANTTPSTGSPQPDSSRSAVSGRRDNPAVAQTRIGLLNLDADGVPHVALFDPAAPSALDQAEASVIFRPGLSPSDATRITDLFELAKRHQLTQLWVHPRWAVAANLPARLPRSAAGFLPRDAEGHVLYEIPHPFCEISQDSSWSIAPAGKLTWWLHGYEPGIYGAIDVAFPQYNEQRGQWPWVHDDDVPQETGMPDESTTFLLALRYLTHALGMPIRRSPGSVGTGLMRWLHSGSDARTLALEVPEHLPEPAQSGGVELELVWRRPLTNEERHRTFVHAYDKNAQFLGATSSLALGFGEPIQLQSTPAWEILPYRKHPGYWRTAVSTNQDLLLPDPISPYRDPTEQAEGIWLSSATLDLAIELGRVRAVHEAYVWPTSHRALEPWYKRLRDARIAFKTDTRTYQQAAARQLAYQAVKAIYTQAIGWLSSTAWDREGDELWRPDWRDAIIGQARTNLFRNILGFVQSRHVPWMAGADCLYFISDDPDPLSAKPDKMKIGEALSDYKVKDAAIPLEELLPLIDDPAQSVNSVQAYLNRRRKAHAA